MNNLLYTNIFKNKKLTTFKNLEPLTFNLQPILNAQK
jgi:hypothetical protein